MKLNKSRCSEFVLCLLACSDLTFASLNSDLSLLRVTVAVLNLARSVVFLLSNILIYIYYSNSFSYLNILTILILVPIPFVYKCIAPKKDKKRRLISQDFKNSIRDVRKGNNYSELYLKKPYRFIVISLLLTICLVFLIVLLEQPDLKWTLFVIMIQYGSYVAWPMFWGLVCFLTKKNRGRSISKIPDWRVEMVFQDLLLLNISQRGSSKDDEGL